MHRQTKRRKAVGVGPDGPGEEGGGLEWDGDARPFGGMRP